MKNIKYFYSVDMAEVVGAILEVTKGDFITLEKQYRKQFDDLIGDNLEASYVMDDEGKTYFYEHSHKIIEFHRVIGLFTINLFIEECEKGYKFTGNKRVF